MDDLTFGTRNKRGDWKPNADLVPPPVFVLPPRPIDFLKWLPEYFLPWNVLFMASAVVFWTWLTPSVETMKTLAPGWILWLLARNMVTTFLFLGAFEYALYMRRRQSNRFKYNGKFPTDSISNVFWFSSQNIDNMIRTLFSGVPIWTAYEAVILWVYSNGWVPWLTFSNNTIWLICLGLLVPMIHEFHFYCIHRLIHWPPLYRAVHSVHHNSVNPSPWSSLSMHPLEHVLYFSGSLLHLVIPSSPIVALYHLHLAGFGAVVGHVGFDKIEMGDRRGIDTHAYAHYLHHKYFEVNYADGLTPFDRLFGTWHDGSEAADERMNLRIRAKAAKAEAKAAARNAGAR